MATDLHERGEEVADAIRAEGGEASYLAGNVAVAADVEAVVAEAVRRYERLDGAVNAAAIEFELVPLHECTDEDFDRMIAVNLRSVFLCMKHEITAILATSGTGSIVNVASTNAFRAQRNQPAYTASKHGVLGLSRSAAQDYAKRGIRINAICPGAIDTPMLRDAIERREQDPGETANRLSPLGRFGEPDEIAQAALWLCSDASSFTTGHALSIDGGMLSR
jgi:glucose 1-dehydrogenase